MFDIESIVFSRIKYSFSENIKKKYPDLIFTTDEQVARRAKFPTVFIHMLPSAEIGQDLEGSSINGVDAVFQIQVSDNENSRGKEIITEIAKIMKKMRFSISQMPYSFINGDTYYYVFRARRTIGTGDTL